MFVITPTSGSQIAVSSAIWPKPRIASSSTSTSVPGAAREQLQRQPDLGVEVRAAGGDRAVRRDQRGDQVLRRRLADRAGDRDHVRAERAPPAAGERAERLQRPLGREHRAAAGRRGGLARPRRRREHAPGPGAQRAGGEPPAVHALAGQRDEQVTRLDRARVDDHARRTLARAAHQLGARRARRSAPRPRSSSPHRPQGVARDLDVVERLLAPALELLALLVALAGDHDDVAGPRELDRARDRRPAVGVALDVRRTGRDPGEDLVDDRLRRLGARVVRGDDRDVRRAARRPRP